MIILFHFFFRNGTMQLAMANWVQLDQIFSTVCFWNQMVIFNFVTKWAMANRALIVLIHKPNKLNINMNLPYCKQCSILLPQSKKHNQFCSRSCATIFRNTGKIRAVRYKCAFTACENKIWTGKYCSRSCSANNRKIPRTAEEANHIRRARVRECSAKYRAALKNQTPPTADRQAIFLFYKNCPNGYEVDHIIPISKGGLHDMSNLQYLTIKENRTKSNKI
jgi:5-methylcytosine-specific restriction endonuclease McrA